MYFCEVSLSSTHVYYVSVGEALALLIDKGRQVGDLMTLLQFESTHLASRQFDVVSTSGHQANSLTSIRLGIKWNLLMKGEAL